MEDLSYSTDNIVIPNIGQSISWSLLVGRALITIFVLIFAKFIYNARWHPIAHVPGPLSAKISPLWLAWTLWRRKVNTDMRDLHAKYGPIVRIAPNEISFASVESLETIYHGPNPKTGYFLKARQEMFHIVLPGLSIFTAHTISDHRKMRKKTEPVFSTRALSKQEYLYRQHVDSLCKDVNDMIGKEVNIADLVSTHMYNLVSDLAYGEAMVKGRKPFEDFVDNLGSLFVVYELIGFILPYIGGIMRVILGCLPSTLLAMDFIQPERLRARMTKSEGRGDFLNAMMEDQKSTGIMLSDSELQGNSIFLFGAGYLTTSINLSATLYYILRDPIHMERLKKEIREAFSSTSEVESSKLQHLTYLNACINESLRLVPPLNLRFAGRVSPGEMVSGMYVPKGVLVSSHLLTIQRSDLYWSYPEEFKPERWLNESNPEFANDNKSSFKPFLSGETLCLGKQMFYQVARLLLVNLIFQFDLEMFDKDEFIWERDVKGTMLWTDHQKVNVHVSRVN